MELILAILFFSIASAVCVQIFVKSHMLSNDSRALNHAVNECASIAEVIDTAGSIPDCTSLLKTVYPDGIFPESASGTSKTSDASETAPETTASGTLAATSATTSATTSAAVFLFYYDDNFYPCTEETHSYTLSLHLSQEDCTLTARMDFTGASGESIYELETKYHIARGKFDETK